MNIKYKKTNCIVDAINMDRQVQQEPTSLLVTYDVQKHNLVYVIINRLYTTD
jgi:hypothetical protein